MHACRDASSVILYPYGVVFKYLHVYGVAEPCHGLVDGIVHHLVNEMMQSPLGDVADIHRRTLSHRFQAFEDLDAVCGILLFRTFDLFVF